MITREAVRDDRRVVELAVDAELDAPEPMHLSPQIWSRDHLEDRRRIRSFFAQELDRDKIVLHGETL